jgi:thiol-disulfide isomerase/thioredoxin
MTRSLAAGALLVALACGACGGRGHDGPAADMQIIAHGEKVELAEHLAKGKYTLVDFYAPWCPPCRALGPVLERLAASQSGRLALRKVDIVDWTMPVAEQYRIEALPHLMLFDPEGRRVAEGDAVFKELSNLFGDAAREVRDIAGTIGADTPPGDDKPDDGAANGAKIL